VTKPGRLWFPLDVAFWEDPDIVALGESSAVLFQRMIAYSKQHQLDGRVPIAAVRTLGGRRWREKFAPLVTSGLVQVTDSRAPTRAQFGASLAAIGAPTWCQIVAFLAWNDSSDEIEERRKIASEKKKSQRDAKANVPQGQKRDVPGHREEIETEVEKTLSGSERGAAENESTGNTPVLVRVAFAEAFFVHRAIPFPKDSFKPDDVRKVAAWVDEVAKATGVTTKAAMDRVLANFWADDFSRNSDRPWSLFMADPSSYWNPKRPKQSAALKRPDPSRRTGVLD
jgi:hypothetical protein